MAGTKRGGIKAAETNIGRYGERFYAVIGHRGGMNGHTGGFAADPELARRAGAIGGRISKRGKKLTGKISLAELRKKRMQLEKEFNAMFGY